MTDKINKSRGKFLLLPITVLLIIYLAVGVLAYWFNYPYPLKDFDKLRLEGLLSEKKAAVNSLIKHYNQFLSFLSGNRSFRDDITIIVNPKFVDTLKTAYVDKKQILIPKKINDAHQRISDFLHNIREMDLKIYAILSVDGTVVYSNLSEIIGESWAEKDFFIDNLSVKETRPLGFSNQNDFHKGVIFLSPVYNSEGSLAAYIYMVLGEERLAEILKVKKGFYNTGKVMIIGKDGRILFTEQGITTDSAILKEGLISYSEVIGNTPFRIIAAVDESEVHKDKRLFFVYLTFALLMVIVILVQSRLIASRSGKVIKEYKSEPKINLKEFLSDIEFYANNLIGSKDIELILEYDKNLLEKYFQLNMFRLWQILTSLLNISIKNTDTGIITIILSLIKKDEKEYLEVSISDTGKGLTGMEQIMLKELDNELLAQIEESDKGLSINAKKMVESINGKLEIENIPDKGLLSIVTIPIPY